MLASEILNCPELQYDCYKVGGHGVVTVDRKRGKAFIGNKLSHMRKPSAYKGKSMVSVLSLAAQNAVFFILNKSNLMHNIPFIPGGIDNLSRDSRSSRVTLA